MFRTILPGLLLSGCAAAGFQEQSVLLAEVSPGRRPRWVQASVDGRIVAFTEIAQQGADRVVVSGRAPGTYHYL